MKAALERFAKSWVLESENIRAYFVSGSSVSFTFCMLMLALQRKGFWQSSLLGKLQTPPMTSLQPWDRTARIKWAQKRSYQRPTRYMKGYILPGGYRGRFALSIVRHCEEQVGIAGAVFNIPIFKKSWVGFILHPKYKVFWPINSYLSWDSCAMFVNVIIISDTHLVRVYIKTVVDKRKEKCRPRFSCTRCFLVCTILLATGPPAQQLVIATSQ